MRHVVIAHHPADTPGHCDTCDTLARPHGVSYVVEGHGEFCSRRCYEHWAGEPWSLLEPNDDRERCAYVPPRRTDLPPGPAPLPKIPCVLPMGHDGRHDHWPFVA